jgi:hypothetical protein
LVSKFAKHLQPCKFDAIAAIATFALGANLPQIYFFAQCTTKRYFDDIGAAVFHGT